MEQFIRMLMVRLVSKGMEVTSIPAFIRNVANTIVANPSMSLEDLASHLQLLGWNNFELDDYTFCLIIATFEPDLASKLTQCFDQTFNPQALHELADEKERMPTFQIGRDKRLKE